MKYPIGFPMLGKKEKSNLLDCIDSGWISSRGKYIEKFEKSFSSFCGVKYAVAVYNGTAALNLALMTLGIKPGDEIIIPNLTFGATANAVISLGAKPVLVDVDRKDWNIDPDEIERNISKKTRAIIVVHLYGMPCAMDRIMKISKKRKLKVIEDASEAHGAEYAGKKVGGWGEIGCFSFFGNKIITTGEGGMCSTNSRKLYERMLTLRNQGMETGRKYWQVSAGNNFRMTNMQAALGLAQMKKIKEFIRKKIQLADWYREEIKKQNLGIDFQREYPKAKNVWWMFTVLLRKKINLEKLSRDLSRKGIDTRRIFYPLP